MHRVERANRFHGEWAANAIEDRIRHGDQIAAAREYLHGSDRGSLLGDAEASGRPGTNDRPGGFGERQRRGHTPAGRAQSGHRPRVTFQQGGDQGA